MAAIFWQFRDEFVEGCHSAGLALQSESGGLRIVLTFEGAGIGIPRAYVFGIGVRSIEAEETGVGQVRLLSESAALLGLGWILVAAGTVRLDLAQHFTRPLTVVILPTRVFAARSRWCGVRIHRRCGRQRGRLAPIPQARWVMGTAAGRW